MTDSTAIKGVKALVEEANQVVEVLSTADAIALHGSDMHVFVDIRDVRELWREGTVPDAVHAPRGMLEFWVDPDSPYHREDFASGKKFIFFCAGGMRSALAAQSVHRMGLAPVAHMKGGYGAWTKAGGETEEKEAKLPGKK